MPDTPTKYFQIGRRSEIRMNANNEPELYCYDKDGVNIVNAGDPLVFNIKPGKGRISFLSAVLLVEADEDTYNAHQATLTALTSGITWETAQSPNEETMIAMNPIKDPPPPPPGG